MSFLSQRLAEKIAKFEKTPQPESELILASDLTSFSLKYFWRRLANSKLKSNCLNVGLVFNGGIGDQVIQAQWARVFVEYLAQNGCQSYNVFMFDDPALGKEILQEVAHVDLIADHRCARKHKFDLLLSIDYFPRLWCTNQAAINEYAPFLKERMTQYLTVNAELAKFSKVCHHYQLMQYSFAKGWTRYDLLGQSGLCDFDRHTAPFLYLDDAQAQATLQKFSLDGERFVTFHSGISNIPVELLDAGVDPIKAKQHATRNIPLDMLGQVVQEFKQRHPTIKLVQLGGKDDLPVEHVDLNLVGQSSLKESLCLLSKAAVHVDNDSGLIHMRHALGQRSVVLWGPTLGAFVGYPEDVNLQGGCSGCMWLTSSWESKCPRGFDHAKCMRDIPISAVVEGIEQVLQKV